MDLFAVCPPGLESVLEAELLSLGFAPGAAAGGVEMRGDTAAMQRLNLWSRTASRVLARLGQVRATSFAELVRKASALPFETVLRRGAPVSLRVTCRKSRLYHSAAVAQRLHEAMQLRIGGDLPRVEHDEEGDAAAQLFVARFDHDVCTVSADSSGPLLHRRGYRLSQSQAPLRETLAAALLLAAGYTGAEPLLDPLCGSGTIAIEAAWIARRRAPGLARDFAFQRWPGHDSVRFEALRAEARDRELPRAPAPILASDADSSAITAARENAARAAVAGDVTLEAKALREARAPPGPGLIATNPPYGVRLGADLPLLYAELVELARRSRYRIVALVPERRSARPAGLHWKRILSTQNGGLRVELLAA